MARTRNQFQIYDQEFFTGATEVIEQNIDEIRTRTNGVISLDSERVKGDFSRGSFFKKIDGLLSRRDIGSNAPVASKKLEQGENISVKLNRKIGPVDDTIDNFKKIDQDPGTMSFVLGQQYGEDILGEYLNAGILAAATAIKSAGDLATYDATGTAIPTISVQNITKATRKFGDKADRVRALLGHSDSFHDLLESQQSSNIFGVSNLSIVSGSIATGGRPIIMTDSPALIDTTTPADQLTVLGLCENAIMLKESEDRTIVSDTITGLENIVMRLQGELAFNVEIKGYQYVITQGVNPSDAVLGAGASWNQVATSIKSTAGVALVHNAA